MLLRLVQLFALALASEFIILDELQDGYTVANGQICDAEGNCVPEVFEPSGEFQKIYKGQKVPKGLHITMDYTTGEKMAKILDKSQDYTEVEAVQVIEGTSEDQPKPAVIHHEVEPDPATNMRQLLTLEEKETLVGLFADLNTTKPADTISKTLDMLSDSAHHIDVGVGIAGNKGQIDHLVLLLSHNNAGVRASSAILLGTILSNNDIAQDLISKNHPNFILEIFASLKNESDSNCRKRLIFALSAMLRGNTDATKTFLALDPYKVLIQLAKDAKLSVKAFAFLNDTGIKFPALLQNEICLVAKDSQNDEAFIFYESCKESHDA